MQHIGIASSLGFNILVETNSQRIFESIGDVNQRAIPDYAFLHIDRSPTCQQEIDCRLIIDEIDQPVSEIMADDDFTNINARLSSEQFVENDNEILLLAIFNHLYTNKGMVCSYGIGLSDQNQNGIFLAGEWGSGKSIVGLSLLRNGHRFIGNDRTVICDSDQGVKMVSGSRPIRLRIGTIARYFPDLLPSYIPKTSPWGSFISYLPGDLGIAQSDNARIDYLFRVKVSPIPDEYCTCSPATEIEGKFAAVRIYHSISYYSLDFNLLHLGTSQFYPRFDNKEKATMRLDLAQKIIQQIQAFEIYGNLKWVSNQIQTITGGSNHEKDF